MKWLIYNRITDNGKIIAKKEGNAKIKVTWKDKNLFDEIQVNVIDLKDLKLFLDIYESEIFLDDNQIDEIVRLVELFVGEYNLA